MHWSFAYPMRGGGGAKFSAIVQIDVFPCVSDIDVEVFFTVVAEIGGTSTI